MFKKFLYFFFIILHTQWLWVELIYSSNANCKEIEVHSCWKSNKSFEHLPSGSTDISFIANANHQHFLAANAYEGVQMNDFRNGIFFCNTITLKNLNIHLDFTIMHAILLQLLRMFCLNGFTLISKVNFTLVCSLAHPIRVRNFCDCIFLKLSINYGRLSFQMLVSNEGNWRDLCEIDKL